MFCLRLECTIMERRKMIDQEMDMATCKEDRNRETTNVVKIIR